jgi:hypothetical protein
MREVNVSLAGQSRNPQSLYEEPFLQRDSPCYRQKETPGFAGEEEEIWQRQDRPTTLYHTRGTK